MPTLHACRHSVHVLFFQHLCVSLSLLKDVISRKRKSLMTKRDRCLNEWYSDPTGKLWEGKIKLQAEENKNDRSRWHSREADLCWPERGSTDSQWSRVKRGMKACEWVSAEVRVPCIPWAANLPVSPLSPPDYSQCCLKSCRIGCREPTTTHLQTEWVWDLPDERTFNTKLSLTLSFWHTAPDMNSDGLNFKEKKWDKK